MSLATRQLAGGCPCCARGDGRMREDGCAPSVK
jgi:hypothetical protein